MTAIKSTEIHHRADFPLLCMMRSLVTIAEVGVDRGAFSELFLKRHWMCDSYCGIDPYTVYPEMPFSREASYLAAVERYAKYSHAVLIKESSQAASEILFDLQSKYPKAYPKFGFVYLDADHSYEATLQNIEEWKPLLADNGILAGHDYDESHPGVVMAVDDFARDRGIQVYRTWSNGDGPCHSWYMYNNRSTVPFKVVQP